ncbi:MAG: response regulator [Candidatus Bruticola sp.]
MAYKVFVVDDSKFMRMMLGEVITSMGCEVIEVDGGRRAVTMYEHYKPDLVTLDILMPEQDGIETLKQLFDVDPNAKVIMVTALGMEDYIKQAMELGACGFIIKPFSAEQVETVLSKVLGDPSLRISYDEPL